MLSGAVNKVLSKFKASIEPRTSKPRSWDRDPTGPGTSTARGSTTRASRSRDNDSSDSDDFQLLPKKQKKR